MARKQTPPTRSFSSFRADKRRILAVAIRAAGKATRTGNYRQLLTSLSILQLLMARRAIRAVEEQVAEQGLDATPVAEVLAEAFAGISAYGIPLQDRIAFARSALGTEDKNVLRMALTEVSDVSRVVTGVSLASRPTLEGYVRYLNPPSCARCVILAGRVYRWVDGFQRHDNCDCDMIPVENADELPSWATDPMEAFRRGEVTGLSKADTQAVQDGANLSQVVNVRRKAAGLQIAGEVIERGGRLTAEGIYRLASDRDDAIRLLERAGYIRT